MSKKQNDIVVGSVLTENGKSRKTINTAGKKFQRTVTTVITPVSKRRKGGEERGCNCNSTAIQLRSSKRRLGSGPSSRFCCEP